MNTYRLATMSEPRFVPRNKHVGTAYVTVRNLDFHEFSFECKAQHTGGMRTGKVHSSEKSVYTQPWPNRFCNIECCGKFAEHAYSCLRICEFLFRTPFPCPACHWVACPVWLCTRSTRAFSCKCVHFLAIHSCIFFAELRPWTRMRRSDQGSAERFRLCICLRREGCLGDGAVATTEWHQSIPGARFRGVR